MKARWWWLVLLLLLVRLMYGEAIIHSTRDDFIGGEFAGTVMFTPDPDGEDNGAVGLPEITPRFKLLIVFPPDSDPERVAFSIDYYEGEGNPPVLIDCYVLPISIYNTLTSVNDSVSVNILPGSRRLKVPISYFDSILFGVHDVYGYADLTPSGAELTRQFSRIGNKVIIFTHSTIWSSDWASHPNFNSLTDIHNILTAPQASYDTFNVVCKYPGASSSDGVLREPWEIPDTFRVSYTHRRGQIPDNDDLLFIGCGYSDYQGVYFSQHFNPETASYGVFLNYGHTITAPQPWDTKCTINAIYQSFSDVLVSGTYRSSLIDLGESEAQLYITRLMLDATGDGNIEVAMRWSADTHEFSEWQRILPDSILRIAVERYVQYKLLFTGYRLHPPIVHWIKLEYTPAGITQELQLPLPGTVSACSHQPIKIKLHSFAGYDSSSIRLFINDAEYTLEDMELHMDEDTLLVFNPSRPYHHADSITATVLPIYDSLRILSTDTLSWSFYVDLLSPEILSFSPSPETTFVLFPDTFRFVLREEITTLQHDSVNLTVGDTLFTIDSPYLNFVGDTLLLTAPEGYFPYGREYDILLQGLEDTPDYCPPNRAREFELSLFVGRFTFTLPETSGVSGESLRLPLVSDGGSGRVDSIKIELSYDPTVISDISLELAGGWAEGSMLDIFVEEEGKLCFKVKGDVHIEDGVMLWVIADIGTEALEWDFSNLVLGEVQFQGAYEASSKDGFLVINPTPTTWLFDLEFQSVYAENTIITFGMAPAATSGFDPGMDTPFFPPPPTYVSAYFPLSDPEYPYITSLSRDIKGLSNYQEWVILSHREGSLSWDREDLPSGQFLLNDIIDLRVHDSLTLCPQESLVISYELPSPKITTLQLDCGWNLISIPYSLARPDEPGRICPYAIGYPYSFSMDEGYFLSGRIEPGRGYWLLSTRRTGCRIAGLWVDKKKVLLDAGWNLIGGLDEPVEYNQSLLSPSSAYLPNSLYEFATESVSYTLTDSLFPTKGYFLMVAEPCTLSLGE